MQNYDQMPEWAKTLIDLNRALTTKIEALQTEVNLLKSQKQEPEQKNEDMKKDIERWASNHKQEKLLWNK